MVGGYFVCFNRKKVYKAMDVFLLKRFLVFLTTMMVASSNRYFDSSTVQSVEGVWYCQRQKGAF